MKISEYIELLKELPQDALLWFNYDTFDWYHPWLPELITEDDFECFENLGAKAGDYVISMG